MDNLTYDEVLKAFRTLPLEEQKRLLAKILEEETSANKGNGNRFECEMRWLNEHKAQYAGQWVALDGDRLISHGKIAQEVFAAAEASGVHLPLVVRVESQDELPFGGW